MFEDTEVHSLTKAGVVLVVYLFVVLLTYFALSVPINALFDALEGASWAAAESQKATYMPYIRQVCTIFFAVFISIPIVWFFFWVFHREPVFGESSLNNRNWRE